MTATRFDSVRRRVRGYRKDVEKWKEEHDLAMKCWEFEMLLQHGLSVYEAINIADETWRRHVLQKNAEYDPAVSKRITQLYKRWMRPCEHVMAELEVHERHFGVVEYADQFRRACREVKGLLTDDNEFFSGEKLTRARDEAIDAHRGGQCEQWSS